MRRPIHLGSQFVHERARRCANPVASRRSWKGVRLRAGQDSRTNGRVLLSIRLLNKGVSISDVL
jgi:hypothetical protein